MDAPIKEHRSPTASDISSTKALNDQIKVKHDRRRSIGLINPELSNRSIQDPLTLDNSTGHDSTNSEYYGSAHQILDGGIGVEEARKDEMKEEVEEETHEETVSLIPRFDKNFNGQDEKLIMTINKDDCNILNSLIDETKNKKSGQRNLEIQLDSDASSVNMYDDVDLDGPGGLFEKGPMSADERRSITLKTKPGAVNAKPWEDRYTVLDRTRLKSSLPQDTFSFLISSKVKRIPFVTGCFIAGMKVIVFSLILMNLRNAGDEGGFSIPASVTSTVAITQVLTIAISVTTQDDLLTSLRLIHEGYSEKRLGRAFPETNFAKWLLATSAMFFVGALGLGVTTLLVVTADDVVDLILDFTAAEFVSMIDNSAFILARAGFLGTQNKEETHKIEETEYEVPKKKKQTPLLQIILLILAFLGMISVWIIIHVGQLHGKYLPQHLIVQFDDSLRLDIGAYSGLYKLENNPSRRSYGRVKYVEIRSSEEKGTFGYCLSNNRWTFRLGGDDACKGIVARSAVTTTFDITDTAQNDWQTIDTTSTLFYPMNSDSFFLEQACERDEDCGGGRGQCVNDKCNCTTGHYGLRCHYSDNTTCPTLTIEDQSGAFRASRDYAKKYDLLKTTNGQLVSIYNHSVYYGDSEESDSLDVMMYTGVRWVITSGFAKNKKNSTALAEDLFKKDINGDFHSQILTGIEFVSDAVSFNTPEDGETSTGVQWSVVSAGGLGNVETLSTASAVLLCAECNNLTNKCFNDNTCDSKGRCDCENGAQGVLCQITPVRNGHCDVHFNRAAYGYDGGDCCEATCFSTDQFTCGQIVVDDNTATTGSVTLNVGFPNCKEYSCETDLECWVTKSQAASFLSSPSNNGFATLSANGFILVLSEPDLDAVRVLDQMDSEWVVRGSMLEGQRGSKFGKAIAINTLPGLVVSRRYGRVPVLLAVGSRPESKTGALVSVYSWAAHATSWEQLGSDINVCDVTNCGGDRLVSSSLAECDIAEIGISESDNLIRIATTLTDHTVLIHEAQRNSFSGNGEWVLNSYSRATTSSLSVTGDMLFTAEYPYLGDQTGIDFRMYSLPSYTGNSSRCSIDLWGMRGYYDLFWDQTPHYLTSKYKSAPIIKLSSDGSRFGAMLFPLHDSPKLITGTTLFVGGKNRYVFVMNSTTPVDFDIAISKINGDGESRVGAEDVDVLQQQNQDPVVVFSSDGENVAVKTKAADDTSFIRMYARDSLNSWVKADGDFSVDGDILSYGISESGTTTVVTDTDKAIAFKRFPVCGTNETNLRLSLTLDENPGEIVWFIETVHFIEDTAIRLELLSSCINCLDDNSRYSRTEIAIDTCVTSIDQECVRIGFSAGKGLGQGGSFSAVFNSTELDPLGEGSGGMIKIFLTNDDMDDVSCPGREEKFYCGDDESHLIVVVTLDGRPSETRWILTDRSGTIYGDHDHYENSVENRRSTQMDQYCVPKNECFTFIIEDRSGDGMCCEDGDGSYSLYLDGKEIYNPNGYFTSGNSQSVWFGESCTTSIPPSSIPLPTESPSTNSLVIPPPLTIEAVNVSLSVPNGTGWEIIDGATGKQLHSSQSHFLSYMELRWGHEYSLIVLCAFQENGAGGGNGCESDEKIQLRFVRGWYAIRKIVLIDEWGIFDGPNVTYSFRTLPDLYESLDPPDDLSYKSEYLKAFQQTPVPSAQPSLSWLPSSVPSTSPAPSETMSPTGQMITLILQFIFDSYPEEIGWSIVDEESQEVLREVIRESYSHGMNIKEVILSLPVDRTYVLTVNDTYGDGLPGGGISIYSNDTSGDDGAGSSGEKEILYNNTNFLGSELILTITTSSMLIGVEISGPTSAPSHSSVPSVVPSIPPRPSVSSSPTVFMIVLTLRIFFDSFPSEIGWSVIDDNSDETLKMVSPGEYTNVQSVVELLYFPVDGNFTLYVNDTYGDGLFEPGGFYLYSGRATNSSGGDGSFEAENLLYSNMNFTSYVDSIKIRTSDTDAEVVSLLETSDSPSPSSANQPSPTLLTATTGPSVGRLMLSIRVELEQDAEETGWALLDIDTNEFVWSIPPGTYEGNVVVEAVVDVDVYENRIYELWFYDTNDDGFNGNYNLYIVDELGERRRYVLGGSGNFNTSTSHQFGLRCNICGYGSNMTIPDGIVFFPELFEPYSCEHLQILADSLLRDLSIEECEYAQEFAYEPCGCVS